MVAATKEQKLFVVFAEVVEMKGAVAFPAEQGDAGALTGARELPPVCPVVDPGHRASAITLPRGHDGVTSRGKTRTPFAFVAGMAQASPKGLR